MLKHLLDHPVAECWLECANRNRAYYRKCNPARQTAHWQQIITNCSVNWAVDTQHLSACFPITPESMGGHIISDSCASIIVRSSFGICSWLCIVIYCCPNACPTTLTYIVHLDCMSSTIDQIRKEKSIPKCE